MRKDKSIFSISIFTVLISQEVLHFTFQLVIHQHQAAPPQESLLITLHMFFDIIFCHLFSQLFLIHHGHKGVCLLSVSDLSLAVYPISNGDD